MPEEAVCGPALRTCEGGTVRLPDVICWRHIQGRSCLSVAQQALGSSTDVVLVPIPPPARAASQPRCGATPAANAVEADEAIEQIKRVVLDAASALRAAGLQAAVDDDPKHTPGAKFHRWEQLGVQLRVDVGRREAWSHRCSLSIAGQLHAAAGAPPALPPACKARSVKGRVVLGDVPIDLLGALCRWYVDNGGGGGTSQQPCTKLHLWQGQVVCHQHVRNLVGLGGRCQCGGPHKTMAELKDEVASTYHSCTGLRVADWLNDGAGAQQDGVQHVALFVGGLPQERSLDEVKAALWAALQPHGVARVKVGKGHMGLSRGWGYGYFPAEHAAASLLEATGGDLTVLGHAARISRPTGRADTLFPALPPTTRARLRIDSVAAFSVTDQYTADIITSLVACLASDTLLPHPPTPATAAPASPTPTAGTPAMSSTCSTSPLAPPAPLAAPDRTTVACSSTCPTGRLAPDPPCPHLLPLTITDGTACSGGNTVSFARTFARVHAVELDPDRASDLLHNLSLLSLVRAASSSSSPSPPSASPPASSAAALLACGAPPSAATTHDAATASDGSRSTSTGAGVDHGASSATSAGAEEVPGSSARPRVPDTSHSQPCEVPAGRPPSGVVEVHNQDYTLFWGQLQQDVVFLDPPWGGPQYRQGGPLADLPLGGTTLVALMACLAGACRLCCVRLPKSMNLVGFVEAALRAVEEGAGGERKAVVGVIPFGACKVLTFSFCVPDEWDAMQLVVHDSLRSWWAAPGKCHRPWFYDPAVGAFRKLEKGRGRR